MNDDDLLLLLDDAATAVHSAVALLADWGLAGTREGQYKCDLAADDAVLEVLSRAPVGVLSEESGLTHAKRDIVVVVDPIDGSTNASAGLPWFATSLCAVDADGPRVAVVVNQATGTRFRAVRGEGATIDGQPTPILDVTPLAQAFVGLSGLPDRHLGWRQFRALGASRGPSMRSSIARRCPRTGRGTTSAPCSYARKQAPLLPTGTARTSSCSTTRRAERRSRRRPQHFSKNA
jgi:myo-inositol-1(or 4)-monophosphatase